MLCMCSCLLLQILMSVRLGLRIFAQTSALMKKGHTAVNVQLGKLLQRTESTVEVSDAAMDGSYGWQLVGGACSLGNETQCMV